uniref:Inositol-pentakisphosphate 2-kinase n=1 Tax=Sipha flava TaxID=143950 RepID=A0A2S2QWG9_9HEMI
MSGPDEATAERSLRTLTLSDKSWLYKGEGNANVVLAMPADGTVLRVMKDGGTAETLRLRTRYYDAIRRSFLDEYTDVPVLVSVHEEQLLEVDRRLRAQGCRPSDRLYKGLAFTVGLAAVCPDYTVLMQARAAITPVYCVEIKPKQGWLHVTDRRAQARCAFCAHQYLKLCRGEISVVSRYCPLDLFSGRRERVRRAVRRLLHTPQNNLKMFLDGVPLDSRDGGFARVASDAFGDEHRFAEFVAAVLLDDAAAGTDQEVHAAATEQDPATSLAGCDFEAIPMPRDCVLHKILTMQKMQTTGFAIVYSEYDRSPKSAAAQFGHVDRLVRVAAAGGQFVLDPLDGYLVAATAQDCSLFVTFSGTRMPSDTVQQQRGVVRFGTGWYAVQVKVSDLDPKPLSTVEKHRKRNADVLLACEQYLGR